MKETKTTKKKKEEVVETICKEVDCPIHGNLKTRGKVFEGKVTRKFPKRITIEFDRMVYVKKYERYASLKTKIHARLSPCMEKEVNKGDIVRVMECRPLSKIIHFVVVKKLKDSEDVQ
jgi:small subunit ribosomal protein S17